MARCSAGSPAIPFREVWFEAAANPNWTAVAHNDPFETAIEEHILHPRHGFPLIPTERHRCTQAAASRSHCRPSSVCWPTRWGSRTARTRPASA